MSNKPGRFRRKARTTTVTLCVDPDDAEAIASAQLSVQSARTEQTAVEGLSGGKERDRRMEAAATALANATAAYEAVLADTPTLTLTLQAISPARREQILYEHPPTAEQQKRFDRLKADAGPESGQDKLIMDPDGFYTALLAASVTKVEWSNGDIEEALVDDDAADLWETANNGDRLAIQMAMESLAVARSAVQDLGKG